MLQIGGMTCSNCSFAVERRRQGRAVAPVFPKAGLQESERLCFQLVLGMEELGVSAFAFKEGAKA